MKHVDLRTPFEIFDDMLADDAPLETIAARLQWNPVQARNHYYQICHRLGEQPSED